MPIMVTCNWYIEWYIYSSFFSFSLKDSGSTADGRVLSWQAAVAGSCPDTAEAPPLKHSKWMFSIVIYIYICI